MRFGQIRFENNIAAALFEGDQARPIPGYTTASLIRKADAEGVSLIDLAREMAIHHSQPSTPAIPIFPVEVWGCGCTHPDEPRSHAGEPGEALYEQAYAGSRPQFFFKGTARICVGPGQPAGIRPDSSLTGPAPCLAVVLGRNGTVLGYTLGNDISAWDIARANPLYLTQAKFYKGACALGPVIVTPDELPDLSCLQITCSIERDGVQRFSETIPLARLSRSVNTLIEHLLRANPLPAGSVLLTGTGLRIQEEAALAPGDTVVIRVPEIGELSNPVALAE
ncbi:MAG TPA: fumarylacetoacetate hydrolase family protein [Bryobacteraceae bacterium]|nr:fumarylacetoacetate hydrolase family protein [Bryobacteraceae bacterium]HOL70188.1 fumarylacetoacetate hydrolase family protein [Bryobacteraceae bacterium]HOQ44704.1 fumarylacetoacetate hydrolase family protein [Bryobacteraceae bacterium]HPQ17222.1 fumarylacetoacetate hydrolase family protein [Bryobacteraceae bacterium]HPU71914.1 fumarylacetoacetate hydrolase family protein [Bryobacteraceae bacterium]